MKAPDRLVPDETDVSEFVYYSSGLWTGPEYIRKGAFPVEEIRWALSVSGDWCPAMDCLRSVLSLLESDDE